MSIGIRVQGCLNLTLTSRIDAPIIGNNVSQFDLQNWQQVHWPATKTLSNLPCITCLSISSLFLVYCRLSPDKRLRSSAPIRLEYRFHHLRHLRLS
ncbi:hypothetical protein Pdw03_5610 [Penicillium digitatum]|uniref:Uncharacterized protein n=1 Tax=Penicillium digitatum TaxID=36651 RepID=A0A7T7BQ33_PENDI|nr:hypothetical protein Pdw03_5610 [Penicillium digitatum]